MRAWAIKEYGDNSKVQLLELPKPTAGPDEVLIQVRAASINPVDFKIREGKLKLVLPYSFPLILGNDCSGVVVEVGAQVTRFKVGDEVYTRPHKDRIGTLAEFIAAKEAAVALKPKNISFEQAAGVPLVGLTSWQALFDRGNLRSGNKVFIPAGSGGVGTFAIQLAKHFGAYVATNTSTKNVDFVKSLGADHVIDYKTEDFAASLSDFDLVFDTMGGETQKKAFGILKPDGHLISIVGPPTWDFMQRSGFGTLLQIAGGILGLTTHLRARIHRTHYAFLFMLPDGDCLEKIGALIEAGKITPVVDRVFPFEEAKEALAYVESGRARGKVVVSNV